MKTLIFGHKNPDTDSICAAIAYTHLKNEIGQPSIAARLGELQQETRYVLETFRVEEPMPIGNVKIQVRDLAYQRVEPISREDSILRAYREMERQELKTMAIVDKQHKLVGLVTMKDIAIDLLHGDFYGINTSLQNILEGLGATVITVPSDEMKICGRVAVVAYFVGSLDGVLTKDRIVIVGDRYDVIEAAIRNRVKLIIISGGFELPKRLVELAKDNEVAMISTGKDSYIVSRIIQQCNYITTVMEDEKLITFEETDYLEEVRDDIIRTNYRNFPVLASTGEFLGFVGRKHLLNPGRKRVILVDHNEFTQSADGIEEAEILEILDHHKIGGLNTKLPIRFINVPVGSSCTIIYEQYVMNRIVPSKAIAGLMISGILSDTLHFKSPTCTPRDREVVAELNKIAGLDLDDYFMKMFKAGTSIEGYSEEELIGRDCKEFKLKDHTIGIAQIFTSDIEEIKRRGERLTAVLQKERLARGYKAMILAVTDIVNEGSYFFYATDIHGLIADSFQIADGQGSFAAFVVSRKKQIVPQLMSYLENNF